MQAGLWTVVCKFGGDPAICLAEEAICAKCLQTDGQTDRQTTDAARSHKLIHQNELKIDSTRSAYRPSLSHVVYSMHPMPKTHYMTTALPTVCHQILVHATLIQRFITSHYLPHYVTNHEFHSAVENSFQQTLFGNNYLKNNNACATAVIPWMTNYLN